MRENRKSGKLLWRAVQGGIVILTLLGFLKAIFISLDIDESYAVAQSYRLACGDKLFADMWESHQLSAFPGAIFIKLYLILFHTTDYLVLYLRVIGILIHTCMGAWLYRKIRPEFGEKISFIILFLHLNFLPKWVQMPEFELMHYWFLLAVFLLFYAYFAQERGGWWRPTAAGVCLVGCLMSYPTMILLYPVYLIGMCVLERQKKHAKGMKMFRSSLLFTMGAGVTGIGFLVYLFSFQTLAELVKNISYIFLDESHTFYTIQEKWGMYGEQFCEIVLQYLSCLSIIAVSMIALSFIIAAIVKIKNNSGCSIQRIWTKSYVEFMGIGILLVGAVVVQFSQIWGCLLLDQNQFYLQTRYLAVILPSIYLGIRYHGKLSVFFYFCVLPALISCPAVLIITNMDINVTSAKTFLGVLGSLLMLFSGTSSTFFPLRQISQLHGNELAERITAVVERIMVYALAFGLLAGFMVCRLILIRVSGCLPVTIKASMEQMQEGPEKGIYVLETQAQIWNENYRLIKELVKQDDKMLYIGAENLIYPAAGCMAATPSTQGTTVFNEMFLYYFDEHPEKMPTVIVMDKTFGTNPVYGYFSNTDMILEWIEEHYKDLRIYETDYLKIFYAGD